MSTIQEQVTQKNTLLQNKFALEIVRLPHVKYFAKKVTLPGISLAAIIQPTMFRNMQIPGTKLEYDQQFVVEFDVDVDLQNWLEVFKWMQGLGMPDSFDQYKSLVTPVAGVRDSGVPFSDGRLILYTNRFVKNMTLVFSDMFPSNLSALQLESSGAEVLTASVTFNYSKFEVEGL